MRNEQDSKLLLGVLSLLKAREAALLRGHTLSQERAAASRTPMGRLAALVGFTRTLTPEAAAGARTQPLAAGQGGAAYAGVDTLEASMQTSPGLAAYSQHAAAAQPGSQSPGAAAASAEPSAPAAPAAATAGKVAATPRTRAVRAIACGDNVAAVAAAAEAGLSAEKSSQRQGASHQCVEEQQQQDEQCSVQLQKQGGHSYQHMLEVLPEEVETQGAAAAGAYSWHGYQGKQAERYALKA